MDGFTEFPRQKISRGKKTEQWKKDCVDSVIAMCNASINYRRSADRNKRRNYRLFNNKIDIKDFEHIINPYGSSSNPQESTFPATLQPYDIVSPIFNLLMGEEAKRLFNPVVRAINEESISNKERVKAAMILQNLQQIIAGQQPDYASPDDIEKYMTYTYQEMCERIANQLMQYYRKYLDLPNMFQSGWKDALLAGEELYDISIVAGEPKMRRVNPLGVSFILPSGSDYIDDSPKIVEKRRMHISEIIDEFYEDLSPSQIDQLEKEGATSSVVTIGSITMPMVDSYYSLIDEDGAQQGYDVYKVKWKSMKKVGIFHYKDPQTGMMQETMVDEDFQLDKSDPTQWMEWMWISEFWEGVRIHTDIYLNMRPCKHQFRSMMNISECRSGYVGTVYNATNAQSVSLMDRLVPWIYLYLHIWYRTELLIAKNIGNLPLIDMALIPDGWDMNKWMYYASAMGFGFVNSFNEGEKGVRNGTLSQSNQNKSIDLDQGNAIQHHISTLQFIEKKLADTSGVTDQRLGSISTSELVGNVERAVAQSSHVTEELFRVHNNVKVRALTALIEVAKEAYMGMQKKMQYVADDLATAYFTIDGNEFANAEYGVFVSDSSRDNEALQAIKQLMQAGIQNDKIQFSQVLDVYTSESIADTKNKIRQAEQQAAQQAQEMEKAKMALEQQAMQRDDYNKEADRQVKIQVAEISAMGFAKEGEDSKDIMEQAKLSLKEREVAFKEHQAQVQNMQDDKREARENRRLDADIELKSKKLEVDRMKAKQKPKTTKK